MNTAEPRLLRVEALADLPVLWATFQRLDLPATLDRHFPRMVKKLERRQSAWNIWT
jgi:hypothetical protein